MKKDKMTNNRWLSDENAHNVSNIFTSFAVWSAIYLAIYSRKTSKRILSIAPNTLRLKRQELAVKIVSIIHAVYTAYGAHIELKDFDAKGLDFVTYSDNAVYYANVAAGYF